MKEICIDTDGMAALCLYGSGCGDEGRGIANVSVEEVGLISGKSKDAAF